MLPVLLALLHLRPAAAIDPQERIGSCKPFALNASHQIFANEGVWFPQYRSLDDKAHTKGNNYTCHVLYEKVYVDEGEPSKLESDSYYTLNGRVMKEAHTSSYENTSERGKLQTTVEIPGNGKFHIFNYILKVTPKYRVRYVCTDFKNTISGVTAIYIDTRKEFPSLSTIMEAHEVLLNHGLAKTLIKIRQKNCTRPINMKGYVPLFSEDDSGKSPK